MAEHDVLHDRAVTYRALEPSDAGSLQARAERAGSRLRCASRRLLTAAPARMRKGAAQRALPHRL